MSIGRRAIYAHWSLEYRLGQLACELHCWDSCRHWERSTSTEFCWPPAPFFLLDSSLPLEFFSVLLHILALSEVIFFLYSCMFLYVRISANLNKTMLHTCFKDLIGCLGFSSFSGPSPLPCESLDGLFNIFTVGFGGTYWDLRPSSPKIIILVFVLWLDLYPKNYFIY